MLDGDFFFFFFRHIFLHKWPASVVPYEKASSRLSGRGTWKHKLVKYVEANTRLNYSSRLELMVLQVQMYCM